jgi:Zn-dependent membrane protease YugP
MKDSASAHNTIVAFYQKYSRYRYLYFTTGKQWDKELLDSKGMSTNQHTSIAIAGGNVMTLDN